MGRQERKGQATGAARECSRPACVSLSREVVPTLPIDGLDTLGRIAVASSPVGPFPKASREPSGWFAQAGIRKSVARR